MFRVLRALRATVWGRPDSFCLVDEKPFRNPKPKLLKTQDGLVGLRFEVLGLGPSSVIKSIPNECQTDLE